MKYMGSKARIAKNIGPIIQKAIDTSSTEVYIEPFCGGLNLTTQINASKMYMLDANKYLISLWRYLQSGGQLPQTVSREEYNECRKACKEGTDEYPDWYIGCVGFLASYNGRWYDGGYAQAGYEQLKNGKQRYRDYYTEARTNVEEQWQQLKEKELIFRACDYRTIQPQNAVIYCDPPYKNTKGYANAKNFDYTSFWDTMRKWSTAGNNVVYISEQSAPNDFKVVWQQEVCRSIKAQDKKKAVERLYIYEGCKNAVECF